MCINVVVTAARAPWQIAYVARAIGPGPPPCPPPRLVPLRRALAGLDQQQGLEMVLGRLKDTQTNVEFLMQVQKSLPGANGSKED